MILSEDHCRAVRNLETIIVPDEITRVDGCDCGGSQWHRVDCTIWQLLAQLERSAAVQQAEQRTTEFTAALKLQALLAGSGQWKP